MGLQQAITIMPLRVVLTWARQVYFHERLTSYNYITYVFYCIPLGYSSFTCTGFLDSLDSAFFCFSFYQTSSGSTSKKKDEK